MMSIGAFAAWLGVAGAAFGAMDDYASAPGAAGDAPTTWPSASRLPRTGGRAAIVLVAHTKCACTRASLHELERIMARAGDRADAFVVFVGPRDPNGDGSFDPRATARAIAGVRVVEDEREAHLFGAATSGQVMVYDARGGLAFRGGITSARGHEGDSAGNERVRALVSASADGAGAAPRAASAAPATDVFGCALFDTHADPSVAALGARGKP